MNLQTNPWAMRKTFLQLILTIRNYLEQLRNRINAAIKKHWYKVAFLVSVAIIVHYKDLSINIHMNAAALTFFKESETDREVVHYEEKNGEGPPLQIEFKLPVVLLLLNLLEQ